MPETMFPRVKLERKTSPKELVAANGEQIKDVGEKNIPLTTNEGIHRCITFRNASVVKPFILSELDEKNPHIRNIRDGAVIRLDVNNGVCAMYMWICLDETGAVFSWQGQ